MQSTDILRAVLDTAVRDGALAANPAAAIRRPRVTAKEAPHLTPGQVAELLRAADGSRYAPLMHTGLRRGEGTRVAVVGRRLRQGRAAGPRHLVADRRRPHGHRT